MITLYSIWGGLNEHARNPNTITSWAQVWEGLDKVELPLAWAKAYAEELSKISNLPVEVRNRNHKVRAAYGMEEV